MYTTTNKQMASGELLQSTGSSAWHSEDLIVVQSLSRVKLFVTPWTAACQASLSFTISWNLLKLMSIGLVMLPNHLIFCHLFLLLP